MNSLTKPKLRGLSENSLICGRRHRIPFTQFPDAHSFLIDGEAPILRERDTVTAETANTPAKRLYLCVQTMYLKSDIPKYQIAYQGFLRDLRNASPGDRLAIDAINAHVSSGALYKALKEIRKLMKREDALMAA